MAKRSKLEEMISRRRLHEQSVALMRMGMAAGLIAFDKVTKQTPAHCKMDEYVDAFTEAFQLAIDDPEKAIADAEDVSGMTLEVEITEV